MIAADARSAMGRVSTILPIVSIAWRARAGLLSFLDQEIGHCRVGSIALERERLVQTMEYGTEIDY
jgi:hypothetical protein